MKIVNAKNVPRAISKYLLRLHQMKGLLIVLCLDAIMVIEITTDESKILNTIQCHRSDRIGLFPGFDPDEFPFVL